MLSEKYTLLSRINSPSDLKKLNEEELVCLCDELRRYIIEVTSVNPGHLGASLGTIELTVAIHYVFDVPEDKLVWDVGHQAYAHKILTGRRDEFVNNRKYGGISGFPKMSESEYDVFGGGHASISISAALGMAVSSYLEGNILRNHIAVIGDGALTGGVAFEGLNHASTTQANILVILNDNGMAIDKNVGAMSNYLVKLTTSKTYNRLRNKIWDLLSNRGIAIRRRLKKAQHAIKGTILNSSNLFESLGFRYFGAVDGHDVMSLIRTLQDIKKIQGAKLLHCVTVKGKGLKQAEADQQLYHAPGLFDKATGEIIEIAPDPETKEKYQVVFGETICQLAEKNSKIVGVTPAMLSGCSLDLMMSKFPQRTFDVGIAEQHAVTFSAGMASSGYIPFCNIYSSFLQRAYDQIIHDVALQNLPVIFCIDRAGLVGEDGATHHGMFDLAYLRCIPNMIIASPMNELELRNMMFTAVKHQKPFAIRYPRGKGVMSGGWKNADFDLIPIGKGRLIKAGKDIAIIAIGHIGNDALEAANIVEKQHGIQASVYDIRFLKPIDETLLHEICQSHTRIITIENGVKIGGLGSAVSEFISEHHYPVHLKVMGLPDEFVEQGSISELQSECKISIEDIVQTILMD